MTAAAPADQTPSSPSAVSTSSHAAEVHGVAPGWAADTRSHCAGIIQPQYFGIWNQHYGEFASSMHCNCLDNLDIMYGLGSSILVSTHS